MTLPRSDFGSRLASAEPLAAAEPVAEDPLAAFDEAADPAAEPAGEAAADDAAPPPDDEQAASTSVSVARTARGRRCVRIVSSIGTRRAEVRPSSPARWSRRPPTTGTSVGTMAQ